MSKTRNPLTKFTLYKLCYLCNLSNKYLNLLLTQERNQIENDYNLITLFREADRYHNCYNELTDKKRTNYYQQQS